MDDNWVHGHECTFVWCYRERKCSTTSVAFGGCTRLAVNQPPHWLNCHLNHRNRCHQLPTNRCSMNFCGVVVQFSCAMQRNGAVYLCPVLMWIVIVAVSQQQSVVTTITAMIAFVRFHRFHLQLNHHQQNHRTLAFHCCHVHYDCFAPLNHAFHWPQPFHTMHLYSVLSGRTIINLRKSIQ